MLWLKSFEPRGDTLQALHRICLEHGTVFLCGAQRQQLQPAVRHPGTVTKVRIATPGPLVWVQATRQPLVRQLTQLVSGKLQMHWYRSRWVVWQQCHLGVPQTIGGP